MYVSIKHLSLTTLNAKSQSPIKLKCSFEEKEIVE